MCWWIQSECTHGWRVSEIWCIILKSDFGLLVGPASQLCSTGTTERITRISRNTTALSTFRKANIHQVYYRSNSLNLSWWLWGGLFGWWRAHLLWTLVRTNATLMVCNAAVNFLVDRLYYVRVANKISEWWTEPNTDAASAGHLEEVY